MKSGTHHRSRRVGSALGRIARGDTRDNPGQVFTEAVALAVSRRLVPTDDVEHAYAFADAYLVAWLRHRFRHDDAKALRRGLMRIAIEEGVRAALPRGYAALGRDTARADVKLAESLLP